MSIKFNKVEYTYVSSVSQSVKSLTDINLSIEEKEFVAIVGHTGSGKSTLIQNINGILQPTSGNVCVNEHVINQEKIKNSKELRRNIGVSFQFSESQLFEETVLKDVMFGPINFGFTKEKAMLSAKESLEIVGISEDLYERSPFELSGGQMRRVAIAGILAYNPEILILDEPTAGLDPIGQLQIMDLLKKLNELGKTIIVILHDLNHVVEYAKRIVLMKESRIEYDGLVDELFSSDILVDKHYLELPHIYRFSRSMGISAVSYDDLLEKLVSKYGK